MNDTHPVSLASKPRSITFDGLAQWSLLVSLVLSAVLFIPTATVPFIFSKVTVLALGALIALGFYILARLTRGNIVVPPLTLIGALWLVPTIYLLSSLFSGSGVVRSIFGTEIETDTFGFILLLSIIATVVALAFRRGSQFKSFFKVGAILSGFVLSTEIASLLFGVITPNHYPATTNLIGSFTDMGMFAGLSVVIVLLSLRFLSFSRQTHRALWALLVAALIVTAIVNATLVWILVSFTSFGLFVAAILRRRGQAMDEDFEGVVEISNGAPQNVPMRGGDSSDENLGASLVVLVIGLFFLIGGQTLGAGLTSAFGAGYLDVRPSWQATFAVGGHSYASSPLFGSGPGTFGTQWLKFRDASINDTVFWNVDFTSGIGFIPTSFITTGILGALAWLVFLALFIGIGIRSLLLRAPEEQYMRFAAIASFVGACYVIALSVFTVPGPVILTLGFMLIGIFISSLRYAGRRQEWGIIFSRSPQIGFVIVFVLTILLLASVVSAYTVVERYLGSVAYNTATESLAAGNIPAAIESINRSILYAPTDRAYQVAAAIGISQMQAIATNNKLSPAEAQQQFQAALSGSLSAAKTATTINPDNYQNWISLGSVYQTVVPLKIEGAYANAKDAYGKAAALNPSSPTIPYTVAQLEVANNDAAAAEKSLIGAISLKHDYAQAIFLLSQIQVQQGKAKEALQTAEAAAFFAPNDQNVLFQVGILRSGAGDQAGAATELARAVEINPQFANARFFLAVVYAQQRNYADALVQLRAVAAMSNENAKAVEGYIAGLVAGRNPFPPSALGALGVPASPVSDTQSGVPSR